MVRVLSASEFFTTALELFPAGRLPRIFFSEFLKRQPDLKRDIFGERDISSWSTDRSARPEALLSVQMDSFKLLN